MKNGFSFYFKLSFHVSLIVIVRNNISQTRTETALSRIIFAGIHLNLAQTGLGALAGSTVTWALTRNFENTHTQQ